MPEVTPMQHATGIKSAAARVVLNSPELMQSILSACDSRDVLRAKGWANSYRPVLNAGLLSLALDDPGVHHYPSGLLSLHSVAPLHIVAEYLTSLGSLSLAEGTFPLPFRSAEDVKGAAAVLRSLDEFDIPWDLRTSERQSRYATFFGVEFRFSPEQLAGFKASGSQSGISKIRSLPVPMRFPASEIMQSESSDAECPSVDSSIVIQCTLALARGKDGFIELQLLPEFECDNDDCLDASVAIRWETLAPAHPLSLAELHRGFTPLVPEQDDRKQRWAPDHSWKSERESVRIDVDADDSGTIVTETISRSHDWLQAVASASGTLRCAFKFCVAF